MSRTSYRHPRDLAARNEPIFLEVLNQPINVIEVPPAPHMPVAQQVEQLAIDANLPFDRDIDHTAPIDTIDTRDYDASTLTASLSLLVTIVTILCFKQTQ